MPLQLTANASSPDLLSATPTMSTPPSSVFAMHATSFASALATDSTFPWCHHGLVLYLSCNNVSVVLTNQVTVFTLIFPK